MGNTSLNKIDPLYNNTLNIKSNINLSGSVVLNSYSLNKSSPGEIVQVRYVQSTSPTHIETTTTDEAILNLTVSITPKYKDSTIKVEFNSSMMHGGNSEAIVVALYRKIGNNVFFPIIPINGASSPITYLGWFYDSNTWRNMEIPYFDMPNTTEQVTYQIRYRKWAGTVVNYLVRETMYYGWVLTEIKS
jgi:hypothetical protein